MNGPGSDIAASILHRWVTEVVLSPAYRDDKRGTTLQMLPDLLSGHQEVRLSARAGATRIEGPQALLVSNGPYEMSEIAGLGCLIPVRDRDTGWRRIWRAGLVAARQAAGRV